MDEKMRQEIALHRWAVIAEAANPRLTGSERGAVVRAIAAREHAHPDGTMRRYSRGTIDRWLRAWRAGGVDGLRPVAPLGHREGAGHAGAVRRGRRAAAGAAGPVRGADRLDLVSPARRPGRRSGPSAGSCAAPGCTGPRWTPRPKAYGRYEAARPNERWVTDVLVGPWVPYPKRDGSARARLFLIVDDHSRLLVDGRFYRPRERPHLPGTAAPRDHQKGHTRHSVCDYADPPVMPTRAPELVRRKGRGRHRVGIISGCSG